MKKPTLKLYERQRRIACYRQHERNSKLSRKLTTPEHRYVAPGDVIVAPASFDLLRGSGIVVCKFLRAIATQVLKLGRPTKLDFRKTEIFHVPATILLFAEIDRITSLSTLPKPVTIIDPISRRPREVLKQIGLHNLTDDSCDIIPERDDVVYWRATKGSSQSGDSYGSILEAIAEKANRDHARQIEISGVWRGVNEAIANSIDHAYKVPRYDGFNGLPETKWWMFSQIKDGIFTLAVCDLGCGYKQTIRETIPEQFISTLASTFFGGNPDAFAIDVAMEYGRSGTKQNHRGKGSRDVLSVLQTHGEGDLVVVSNTGWQRYEYKNKQEEDRLSGGTGIDIGGTIVWWKLPLKELENAHH